MTITYSPLSDEELNANRPLLKEGEYKFQCFEAVEQVSQNRGNPMMKLSLKLYDSLGNMQYLTDYIVFTKESLWKLKQFCASIGRDDIYRKGLVDRLDFVGKSGMLKIKIGKDNRGEDSAKATYIAASEKIDINAIKSGNFVNPTASNTPKESGYGDPQKTCDPEFFKDVPF